MTMILALSACSESQVGKASANGFTRSYPLGDAEAQTKFKDGDMISVQADGQDAVTYQLNNNEWQPQGGKFLKWESNEMNFTAYYPATFNGTITQPTEYTSEDDLAKADFMSFSGPRTNTNNSNNLTLTMERKMARVVVEIDDFKDQYAGATIDNVNSLSICGVKAYKHSDGKFYALIKPCEAQNSETFISLEVAEGESKTTTETLAGIPALTAGNSYTYKLTVGKNKISVSGISVANWNTGTITDNGKAEQIIRYVTFTAEAEQKFKMTTSGNYTISGLQYSVKNGKWQDVVANTEITFGGENGDLRLRGTNPYGTANHWGDYSTITFTKDAPVACTGDIRTLLDWNNYNKVETYHAKFCYLFSGCSVLTSAPELPAETLANYCYYKMFINCSNLTSAPVLPAETLVDCCYQGMFTNCSNLTSAPVLPAETLEDGCYSEMFYGCKKLSTVTMLASSDQITNKSAYSYWLYDAGTDKTVNSRTLKVMDADAYTALEGNGYLPEIWKKGATNTKVLNKDNTEIK